MTCSQFSPADAPGESGSMASKPGALLRLTTDATPLNTLGERELSLKTTCRSPSTILALGTGLPSCPRLVAWAMKGEGSAVAVWTRNWRRVGIDIPLGNRDIFGVLAILDPVLS